MKKRWFLLAIVVCVIGAVLIWPHISDKYFARRITVVIDHITGNTETISEQTQGQGFQQTRRSWLSAAGVVRHGVSPRGFRTQSLSESALPARHTDEIFAGLRRGVRPDPGVLFLRPAGSDYCPPHGWRGGLYALKALSSPWGTQGCCWPRLESTWECVSMCSLLWG